jgi:hypothetical protein
VATSSDRTAVPGPVTDDGATHLRGHRARGQMGCQAQDSTTGHALLLPELPAASRDQYL